MRRNTSLALSLTTAALLLTGCYDEPAQDPATQAPSAPAASSSQAPSPAVSVSPSSVTVPTGPVPSLPPAPSVDPTATGYGDDFVPPREHDVGPAQIEGYGSAAASS